MAPDTAVRGFAHHHGDEALRAYRRVAPVDKLAWLQAAWRLTVDFLPERKRDTWLALRAGSASPGRVSFVQPEVVAAAWTELEHALAAPHPRAAIEALLERLIVDGLGARSLAGLVEDLGATLRHQEAFRAADVALLGECAARVLERRGDAGTPRA